MADLSIIIDTNAGKVVKDINSLSKSLVGPAAQARQLDKAFKFLDSSFNKGKISSSQYSKGIQKLNLEEKKLYASIGKTNVGLANQTRALRQTTKSASSAAVAAANLANRQRMSGKSTNKFGMYAQQVGYQVGDFAVQVQSGTNALIAFGQQGTQLAGLLPGVAGAVLGITLAISTAVARSVLESRGLEISFKAIKKSMSEALSPIKPILDAISTALKSVADSAKTVFSFIGQEFARVISYALAFATILAVKVTAGFILSGRAAKAFFSLVKMGIASTGIGILVVLLGEAYIRMGSLIKSAGGLGEAFTILKSVMSALWDALSIRIDIFIAQLKMIYPSLKAWAFGIMNSFSLIIQDLVNKIIDGVNRVFRYAGKQEIGEFFIGGWFTTKMSEAQDEVISMRDKIKGLNEESKEFSESLLESINNLLALTSTGSTGLDTTGFIVPKTDDEDSELSKLLEEQRQRRVLIGLYGEQYKQQERIFDITNSLGDEAKTVGEARIAQLAQVNKYLDEQERLQQRNKDLMDSVSSSIESGMMAMVEGTKSVKDAFKEMAREIIKELYRVLVVQEMVRNIKIAMGYANGGVISSGNQVQAYADGGVVGSPTTFPMSGGRTGLMGEAGPEAIMPLKRGANGKLGVQMEGGATTTVVQNFNFSANGDESVKRIIAQAAPKIAQMTKSEIINDRRRGGTMKATFG